MLLMPFILRLNNIKHNKIYEIKDNYVGDLNLNILYELFKFWNFSTEEIKTINFFINNNEQLQELIDLDKVIYVNADITISIIIIIFDDIVYSKLENIFKNEIYKIKNSHDINIPDLNLKSIELFMDPDFKHLIKIYLNNPNMFNTFFKYIQNGDVVSINLNKKITDLTDDEIIYYNTLVDVIYNLNLGVTKEIIMNKLLLYSGHLNLTVRALLCNI
jgi:hypothetical protein